LTSFLTKDNTSSGQVAKVWMPAAAPLMTRWAKDVSPASSRPEYPRPAMRRNEWQSLNGLWEFAIEDGSRFKDQILVPFCFESALSGIGRGKEVHERVSYRRSFRIPAEWRGKRVLLHFGAVDWETVVFINGREVGRHRGGFTPFSFDITDCLEDKVDQRIEVRVFDPAAYDPHAFGLLPKKQAAFQPMGKQLGSVGIWYTRCTGIWQTVWLEAVQSSHLSDYILDACLESGVIRFEATVPDEAETVAIEVTRDGVTAASGTCPIRNGKAALEMRVERPDAWSPERPALYNVRISVSHDETILDSVETYCAFRSISIIEGRIALNGEPYMLRAVLDQGYWPDGIYTAPSEEALREDLERAKQMGFNTIRKHAKIEEALFYYLCDHIGLLVAQDMPSSQDLSNAEAKANYVNEWKEVIHALRNHPCVVLWIPFNENWGNPGAFQDEIAELTKALDPTRLVIDASGWSQRSKTDIIDHHDYTNNLAQYAKENAEIPQWVGEYGGVAYPVDGHTWMKWWGYQSVKSASKYLQKAKFLTRQITHSPGFSGFCWTQLTDVEQELNGLMTYDRIPKAGVEKFFEIFQD
jgi:beta-galactosidase/beta-glucuronidase